MSKFTDLIKLVKAKHYCLLISDKPLEWWGENDIFIVREQEAET